MRCSPRARRSALTSSIFTRAAGAGTFALAAASSELHGESRAHEIRSMEGGNDIARIHRILVLDEAEAIHELDLCDLSGAMGRKVRLDISLGSYSYARNPRQLMVPRCSSQSEQED